MTGEGTKIYRFSIGGAVYELYLYPNQTTLTELIMGLKVKGILPDDSDSVHRGFLFTSENGKRFSVPPNGNYTTLAEAGIEPEKTYTIVPDSTVAALQP